MSDWNSCFNSSRINDTLQAANDAALAIPGFTGTPTVTVNGSMVTDANGTSSPILSDINAAIDAALAG